MLKRLLVLTALLTGIAFPQDLPKYKFLTAPSEKQRLAALNQAAAQGYRVLLPQPIILLELSNPPVAREYRELPDGPNSNKFLKQLSSLGADGFRYIPYSHLAEKDLLGNKYEYTRSPKTWEGTFKPADIAKTIAQGYDLVGFMLFDNILGAPNAELILQRPLGAIPDPARAVSAFEISDAMRADNVLKRVNELSAQGYRFLAPVNSRKGGGIAVLLEKCGPACGGPFEYKYFDAHDTVQVERDLNEMGKQGFRVVRNALYLRPHLLERDPMHRQAYAYKVLWNKDPAVVENDLNASAKDGWVPIGYVFHFDFPTSAIYLIIEKPLDVPAPIPAAQ